MLGCVLPLMLSNLEREGELKPHCRTTAPGDGTRETRLTKDICSAAVQLNEPRALYKTHIPHCTSRINVEGVNSRPSKSSLLELLWESALQGSCNLCPIFQFGQACCSDQAYGCSWVQQSSMEKGVTHCFERSAAERALWNAQNFG